MLKKELGNFQLFSSSEMLGEARPPFSLSAIEWPGEPALSPETPAETKQRLSRAFSLVADVDIPDEIRGFFGKALCLRGLFGHCVLFVDGEKIAEWRSPPAVFYFPLPSDKLHFSLKLHFPERAVPMDAGIHGGAELIGYAHDVITDVYTEQLHKNEKCELFVRVHSLRGMANTEAVATLYSPSGEIHYLGLVHGEGRILLPNAQRYRTAKGGPAGLYRLIVTLYCDGQPADSYETRIGFRKISVSKDSGTTPFELLLDDAPYFIKASRISAHPSQTASQNVFCFDHALSSFVKMGGNALYATCESGFLSERVYAMCDRLGLLVFQQLPSVIGDDLPGYFAELKDSLSPLFNHPSLSLLILPEGVLGSSELGRAIKGFFALSFPSINVCGAPSLGFSDIAQVSSMPSPLAVRRCLPMEARRIFSYAMESAQDSPVQLISMLSAAAEELPYGASLEDVCYITALASAENAQNALAKTLERGVPGGILGGTLFEGGVSMKPSLMDCILERKALYYDFQKMFSPLFLHVHASMQGVTVTLASAQNEPMPVRVVTSLMDRSNNRISRVSDDCVVSPDAPLVLKKNLAEALGHEREYYVWVCVYAAERLLCEKTALFVPAKYFRFVYPDIHCEIKGSGKNYEIALTASAYVRRLRLSFAKTAARFEKNYFDVVSDAKILLSVETEEVTTSRHLESQLRLRSLYDVGRITEQDLADERDFDS